MRMLGVIILFCSCFFVNDIALSREFTRSSIQLAQQRPCPQVIHCGTKNGQTKEYPTRCAAEDDGATNIEPKTGPACPASK
jgi:hypothetical protein